MFDMYEVKEEPTAGSYLAVWRYNNILWSRTLRWTSGVLKQYCPSTDSWVPTSLPEAPEIRYFVLDRRWVDRRQS